MIPGLSDKHPKSRTGRPEWPFDEGELQCISILVGSKKLRRLTRSSHADDVIDCICKVGEDGVNLMQSGEHGNDIGTWIRISFG